VDNPRDAPEPQATLTEKQTVFDESPPLCTQPRHLGKPTSWYGIQDGDGACRTPMPQNRIWTGQGTRSRIWPLYPCGQS